MNGSALALSIVGALALAGAKRAAGSRAQATTVSVQVLTPAEIRAAYPDHPETVIAWISGYPESGVQIRDEVHGDMIETMLQMLDLDIRRPLPRSAYAKIWTRLSELNDYFSRLRFPLRVYRGMNVLGPHHEGSHGFHWTVNRRIAENFATGEHESGAWGETRTPVLLTGIIERPEDVNWHRTLTDYLVYTAGSLGQDDVAEQEVRSAKVTRVEKIPLGPGSRNLNSRDRAIADALSEWIQTYPNASEIGMAAWGEKNGMDLLGSGQSRVVFSWPPRTRQSDRKSAKSVIKFAFSSYGEAANRWEATIWRDGTPEIRKHLVPVEDIDPMSDDSPPFATGGRWLIMRRAQVATSIAALSNDVVRMLESCGVIDVRFASNLSQDGRVLDYGMGMLDRWKTSPCRRKK